MAKKVKYCNLPLNLILDSRVKHAVVHEVFGVELFESCHNPMKCEDQLNPQLHFVMPVIRDLE